MSSAAPAPADVRGHRVAAGLGVVLLLSAISYASLGGPLDRQASVALEAGLSRALVTFALARGLNAVISAAQGTELSFAPAGVGVTLTPGQILDPVNDLVERFSWVMLFSTVSLGLQRVLLEFSAWLPFSVAVVASCCVAAALHWPAAGVKRGWRQACLRMSLVLLLLRFLVPTTAIVSETLYQQFLAARHSQAEQSMGQARENVEQLNRRQEVVQQGPAAGADEPGLLERARQWAGAARQQLGDSVDLSRYQEAVAETSRDAIDLIVVFLLHTVLLPLAIMLLIWRLSLRLLALAKI